MSLRKLSLDCPAAIGGAQYTAACGLVRAFVPPARRTINVPLSGRTVDLTILSVVKKKC